MVHSSNKNELSARTMGQFFKEFDVMAVCGRKSLQKENIGIIPTKEPNFWRVPAFIMALLLP